MRKLLLNGLCLGLLASLYGGCAALDIAMTGSSNSANREMARLDDLSIKKNYKLDKNKAYVVLVQENDNKSSRRSSLFKLDKKTQTFNLAAYNKNSETISVMEVPEGENTYVFDSCVLTTLTVDAKKGNAYYILKKRSRKQSFFGYCSGQGKLELAVHNKENVDKYLSYDNYELNPEKEKEVEMSINKSSIYSLWKERNKDADELLPDFTVYVNSNEGIHL